MLQKEAQQSIQSDAAAKILRLLAYFDVFDHPLTGREIFENIGQSSFSFEEVATELEKLCEDGYVKSKDSYYFLGDAACVGRRKELNALFEKYMNIAYRNSGIMSRFPFVESVCVSGSVSKGCVDKTSDIDFFIITEPGRLWICRALLTLYKKIFLLNSRKYFCINYFIDRANLEIPDKNVYTATEIAFLLPTYNYAVYEQFMTSNDWIGRYYPEKRPMSAGKVIDKNGSRGRRVAEYLLGGAIGDSLEKGCLKIAQRYYRWKYGYLPESIFRHRIRATHGVSKYHPDSFQEKVLRAYAEKLTILQNTTNMRLI